MNALLRVMQTSKFHYLLISLIMMLVSYPFIEGNILEEYIFLIVTIVVFVAGIYTLDHSPRLRRFAYFNGAVMIGLLLIPLFFHAMPRALIVAGALTGQSFLLLMAFAIVLDIFHRGKVTADTISGAACLYLLIGIFWGEAYSLLEYLRPGSFHFSLPRAAGHMINSSSFSYFSFITLTTIGYGDIAPLTKEAKLLVIMEAILGQLYIAIFLARIIASYQVGKKTKP